MRASGNMANPKNWIQMFTSCRSDGLVPLPWNSGVFWSHLGSPPTFPLFISRSARILDGLLITWSFSQFWLGDYLQPLRVRGGVSAICPAKTITGSSWSRVLGQGNQRKNIFSSSWAVWIQEDPQSSVYGENNLPKSMTIVCDKLLH